MWLKEPEKIGKVVKENSCNGEGNRLNKTIEDD